MAKVMHPKLRREKKRIMIKTLLVLELINTATMSLLMLSMPGRNYPMFLLLKLICPARSRFYSLEI
jgi:hypothetical protein